MTWNEIRDYFPSRWLLIEAIEAHSEGGKRVLEQISVVKTFTDSSSAMSSYRRFHDMYPDREFLFVHTDRETLDITERRWIGIRAKYGNSRTERSAIGNSSSHIQRQPAHP